MFLAFLKCPQSPYHFLTVIFYFPQSPNQFGIQITKQRFGGTDIEEKARRTGERFNITLEIVAPVSGENWKQLPLTACPPQEWPHNA
jgi:hypothetical protein